MAHLKRPELKLAGNVSENFKNFELCFNDFCIQASYQNLAKDPLTEQADNYKSPLLEISALRFVLSDEALSVLRYTIEPQISADDKIACVAGGNGCRISSEREFFCLRKAVLATRRMGRSQVEIPPALIPGYFELLVRQRANISIG